MSTTTIRIDDELKARLAQLAQQSGKTAHAFILEAITQTVEQAEQDNAFHSLADQRWDRIQATGKTVSWDAAQGYLQARARGENPRKPAPRKPKP